jgi:tetratricopeptide (TPR) repeat protein
MVADWASKRPADEAFEQWVKNQQLGMLEAQQLTVAQRLFDWTVRNIQLEDLLEYPTVAVSGPQPGAADTTHPDLPPPMRAVPGPGYQAYPWQTLVHGRGDALQRARVFILLCRQGGIDAVMLAFPGKTTPPRPRPWVPAALIGNQLYLFDTGLGLPVLGPGRQGVATLEQVTQEPTLLAQMTVNSRMRYEISPQDLKNVLVLIDASATALSQRMQIVEGRLTGEYRMILTTSPTRIAEQIKTNLKIPDVGLWRLPYETTWFQDALLDLITKDDNAARDYYMKFGVFGSRTPLVRGRYLHLKGEFDSVGDRSGAKSLYMASRVPQSQLEEITTSKDVQERLGIVRGEDERDIMWESRLSSTEMMITQAKQHASYWLGLAQFDTGKYESAVEWFEKRTLDAPGETPWLAGARYNLGRAYEAQGNVELAKQSYRQDEDSPQRHGNHLRAKLLESR